MWFTIKDQKVQIPDKALEKIDKLIELIPYRCTCANCSLKRIPGGSNESCFYKIVALKKYLEGKIKK